MAVTGDRRASHRGRRYRPESFEYAVPVVLANDEATPYGHIDSPLPVYESVFDSSVLSSSTPTSRADGFFLTRSDVDAGETVSVSIPAIE